MTTLVSTWANGLFVFTGEARHQELTGRPVRGLASDGFGGALAIVDGNSLCRRTPEGAWQTIAISEYELSCAVALGGVIFVGTDDARLLRISPDGSVQPVDGFDAVPGRDTWYAGTAVINGQILGPPLGIRSLAATSDGALILANVHVGGIPRSADGGETWQPTIDLSSDVHEVRIHPTRPDIVTAAAAVGLCISRDGGATWKVEQQGLHALYCSAVAFSGDDILVAAAADHFAAEGALYRRPIDTEGPLVPVGAGLPRWLGGIADTGCISSCDSALAVADKAGNLYASEDAGHTWSHRADDLPAPSSILIQTRA